MKLLRPSEIQSNCLASNYVKSKANEYVSNVSTDLRLLDTGRVCLPVTLNNKNLKNNCYTVSPINTYTAYAEKEVAQYLKGFSGASISSSLKILKHLLCLTNLDNTIQVNNWLTATNLYPKEWDGLEIYELVKYLSQEYPDKSIVFKSLTYELNSVLLDSLKSNGFLLIPSRQVYLQNISDSACFESTMALQDVKKDLKLFRSTTYCQERVLPGAPIDYSRLAELYSELYLKKYNTLNPGLSADWIKLGVDQGWLRVSVLKNNKGSIDAVAGWINAGSNAITAPLFGYSLETPQKEGLYRQLSMLTLNEAKIQEKWAHLSAGAAQFKRNRGAFAAIEYTAIYFKHNNLQRKMAWQALRIISEKLGLRLVTKLKL